MEQAGCRLHFQLTTMAVMGFVRVLPLLWKFIQLVRRAQRLFEESPPDAVILVDFPGFNWWIARKAKKAGIPVFYYLPPQLWAWASWRIRRMRKFVDHVLCGLPFEKEWYAKRNMPVEYVGHPFFDEVADYPLNGKFLDEQSRGEGRIVGVLPGSRNHEIARNWPLIIEVIRKLHALHPDVRFLVANYNEAHRRHCKEMLREDDAELPLQFFVGKTPEIIEAADCCLMVSGSVSLEMMARRTPAVVVYRLPYVLSLFKPFVVRLKWVSLPNLIAGRMIFPEWIVVWFPRRDISRMTAALDAWLSDRHWLNQTTAEIAVLSKQCAQTGATQRTAEAILSRMNAPQHRAAA